MWYTTLFKYSLLRKSGSISVHLILCSVYHRYSTLRHFHNSVASLLPRKFAEFPPKKYDRKSNFDDEYLQIRCIQFNQYFNSILNIQTIRNMPTFQALFLPQDDIEEREMEESSDEEEIAYSVGGEAISEEQDTTLSDYKVVQDLLYHFFVEVFQIDEQSKVQNRFYSYLDSY